MFIDSSFDELKPAPTTIVHKGSWLLNHKSRFCCERLLPAKFSHVNWLEILCVPCQKYYYENEVIFKVITSVYIIKYVKRCPMWSGGTSEDGAVLHNQYFLVKANVGVAPISVYH